MQAPRKTFDFTLKDQFGAEPTLVTLGAKEVALLLAWFASFLLRPFSKNLPFSSV